MSIAHKNKLPCVVTLLLTFLFKRLSPTLTRHCYKTPSRIIYRQGTSGSSILHFLTACGRCSSLHVLHTHLLPCGTPFNRITYTTFLFRSTHALPLANITNCSLEGIPSLEMVYIPLSRHTPSDLVHWLSSSTWGPILSQYSHKSSSIHQSGVEVLSTLLLKRYSPISLAQP